VVKVGSSGLTTDVGGIDETRLHALVGQVMDLVERGHPTVVVSSGAVAAGLPALGLRQRPADLPGLQAAAAVGQSRLMHSYSAALAAAGRVSAQVLLTRDVLANRDQYLHARAALGRMLELGIVPIVNENDTVVVDELRLGDNDRLAAIAAHLVGAGLLVILTDTPGLYSDDPRFADDAELLSAVRHTDAVLDEITGRPGQFGSGGVATKVSAARMAAWSGVPTVIAHGAESGVAVAAARGDTVGTWIEPHESSLSARKLWIAFGLPVQGTLEIDAGAANALRGRGASLLAVGVVAIRGEFERGAAVEVVGPDGVVVAKGRVGSSAASLRSGSEGHDGPVIHRDDLVVFV